MAQTTKHNEERMGAGMGENAPPVTDEAAVGVSAGPSSAPADSAEGAALNETELLKARVASLEDQLLRAKADFQNLQRRNQSERMDAIRYANAELMKAMLEVVDGLQRSMQEADKAADLRPVFDGVRMVFDNFMKALTSNGLEVIEAKGQKFDPTVHEALMRQPSTEVAPGMVVEQVQRGYRLRDRVLRAAKVIVSTAAGENLKPKT